MPHGVLLFHAYKLNLVLRNPPQATRQKIHACNVCCDLVDGLSYATLMCMHPICTKLPEHVRHVMHLNHLLKVRSFHPGWCLVCKAMCTSCRYRCELCCFDLRLDCVLPSDTPTPRFLPPEAPPPRAPCFSCAPVALPRPPYAYGLPFIRPYFVPYASRIFPTNSSSQVQGDRNKKSLIVFGE
ncbi:PREDICTED: uncharacterized protein LOC18597687 [Theobroma cacao]|uniref:Uncharacterized protein LOC18597687 n=1 Tax=Theobroma cacao TaxID=3641 RepID=A0AB32WCJ0_THECC|nr:PREDICTED: uncharacterized protein LOC18597687 [Theobroma cacao]